MQIQEPFDILFRVLFHAVLNGKIAVRFHTRLRAADMVKVNMVCLLPARSLNSDAMSEANTKF